MVRSTPQPLPLDRFLAALSRPVPPGTKWSSQQQRTRRTIHPPPPTICALLRVGCALRLVYPAAEGVERGLASTSNQLSCCSAADGISALRATVLSRRHHLQRLSAVVPICIFPITTAAVAEAKICYYHFQLNWWLVDSVLLIGLDRSVLVFTPSDSEGTDNQLINIRGYFHTACLFYISFSHSCSFHQASDF